MDKQYVELHKALAKKHKVDADTIFTLRSLHIGSKLSREEIARWCAEKIDQPRQRTGKSRKGRREHGLPWYQEILNFVASASKEVWQDIMKEIT